VNENQGDPLKLRLMDILACPYDKHFPLELYILSTNYYKDRKVDVKDKPLCELYCGRKGLKIEELKETPDCEECLRTEIDEGVLYCPECGRWYPIMEEIPILLPDELRNKEEDLHFLRKHKDNLPSKIVLEGKPWSLKEG